MVRPAVASQTLIGLVMELIQHTGIQREYRQTTVLLCPMKFRNDITRLHFPNSKVSPLAPEIMRLPSARKPRWKYIGHCLLEKSKPRGKGLL